METLRQELVQATCKWLESVIHWDGIAETERSAYSIQCEVKERAAFNEAYRSRRYSQLWQQKFQAQEEDFPENLRAVHRAHETLAQARDTRGRMFEAYSKAKFAQADVISPLVGLQLQRNALYQVQKVFREFPNDLDAMWTALSKARAAGVASRDLSKCESIFADAQAKQSFQARIFTIGNVHSLEISGVQPVGDLRQRVADKLQWRSQRTLLLFNGRRLESDSQTLHQCGVTQDSCNFTAAQINEVVEDSVASFQKQTSLSEAAMSTQLATYGLQGPQRLHQPKTEHTVGKPVQRWTFELIKVACCQGVMDFRVAANLYLEVEEGIVGEDQARITVRHSVTWMSGTLLRPSKQLNGQPRPFVLYPKPSSQCWSASMPILRWWHRRCGAGSSRPRCPRDRAAVQVLTATHGKHTSP